jgi:glyoxylase-like metal-dependent hydrolase (beta-lactamase superfamily II)
LAALEIRPGLWRWTAPHPDWKTAPAGSSGDWPREVGCVLYETAGHAVFFDPLADQDDAAFWSWAQERCAGRAVVVALTIGFHERSRERFVSRLAASDALPAAVEAFAFPALDETMYWLPEHRALIPGDRLLGDGDGGLSLCPQSWLRYLASSPTREQMREALGVLRGLDVALVLPSHGEPVLASGREAIARALEGA